MIDAYASASHYAAHLLPVWRALPDELRGTLWLAGRVPTVPGSRVGFPRDPGPTTLVASYTDHARIQGHRRTILMEHGAGQSYSDRHPSYAGGTNRERVALFLCPGPHPAARNRRFYPSTPVVEIGCPALDQWLIDPSAVRAEMPTVVVAFHWDARGYVPEARWAFSYFRAVLPELNHWWTVVGHGHPRILPRLQREYGRLRIPVVDYDTVLAEADVVVVDNSSLGFEAAALGRSVIWLNSPEYRPDVEHGLRFWSAVDVGRQCDDPGALVAMVEEAWLEEDWRRQWRREALGRVYTYTDGRSAERAVEAIREHVAEGVPAWQ